MVDYQKIINHQKVQLLKNLKENHPSHHLERNTYEHSKNVYLKLSQLIKLNFIKNTLQKKKIQNYLNTKAGDLTRKECLLIASIVHDLGKLDTLKKEANGIFMAPHHEKTSVRKLDFLKKLLALTSKDFNLIKKYVSLHMVIFPYLDKKNFPKLTPSKLKKITKNLTFEIILHTKAEIDVCTPPRIQRLLINKLLHRFLSLNS